MDQPRRARPLDPFSERAECRLPGRAGGPAPVWYRLADRSTASPRVWMDAYLAAFAIAARLTLLTFDRDFAAIVHDDFACEILHTA